MTPSRENPLLRVRASALAPGEYARLEYQDAPFSGLVYDVREDGIVTAITAVADGTATDPSFDWLPLPENGIRVDSSFIGEREDYGPELFQNSPVTGVVYFFAPSGACTAEVEFKDGHFTDASLRRWYENGAPRQITGDGESASWAADGRLLSRAIAGNLVYNLIVRDNGWLDGLVLRDKALFDLETIRAFPTSEDFMLLGRAVDSELLGLARSRTTIGEASYLRLIETLIGPEGIEEILAFHRLSRLDIKRNPRLGAEEAEAIRSRRPGLEVTWAPPDPAPGEPDKEAEPGSET